VVIRDVFPGEIDFWDRLAPRFLADLRTRQATLWRLSGLEKKYGPYQHFNGEYEADEMVNEIAVFLASAILGDVDARRKVNPCRRGRPPDVITPDLAPNLLWYFLRNNNSSGRHSVIVTVDSKKKQEEAGPLFEFIKEAIEPLNQYLVIEAHRKPLSPARLARYALQERRRQLALPSTANNPAGAQGSQRASPLNHRENKNVEKEQ
jgi:hypothetical protein